MTLVVLDADGVWHEVYNKTEIRTYRESRRDSIENWQIRTLCCSYEEPECLKAGISRATIDDENGVGFAVTCVRCAALECDHGVGFDAGVTQRYGLSSYEVRVRWPRLDGACPKGCGYNGIAYANYEHYIYGDW